MPQLIEAAIPPAPAQSERKGPLPRPFKGLLIILLSLFGFLLMNISAYTVKDGWVAVAAVLVALCFVIIAMVEVVRAR